MKRLILLCLLGLVGLTPMTLRRSLLAAFAAVLWTLVGASCANPKPYALDLPAAPAHAPRVAIYFDRGVTRESVSAAHRMLAWAGLSVERVDSRRINQAGLEGFDLLCMPGGNMYLYAKSLSAHGKERVREFVRSGGGYLGICGGAYFASSRVKWVGLTLPMEPLALYAGVARGPICSLGVWRRQPCTLRRSASSHPLAPAIPRTSQILYWNGPALIPDEPAQVHVLADYEKVGLPAILAFEYGCGRVFLVGAHPELDGGKPEAGADPVAGHSAGSQILQAAIEWCLRAGHP